MKTVSEIRSAESALMLQKKTIFITDNRKKVHKAIQDGRSKEDLPKHLRCLAEDKFDVTKYKGAIHVTELDLYFCLLVFSTKPLYPKCEMLFKSCTRDAHTMARADFDNFLRTRAKIKLPLGTQEQMWKLLSKSKDGAISREYFIAGWHIHDIEPPTHPDPYVNRVAQVLQMKYYDMDVQQLRERLKAKEADTEGMKLGFDDSGSSDGGHEEPEPSTQPNQTQTADGAVTLPQREGERRILAKIMPQNGAQLEAFKDRAKPKVLDVSQNALQYTKQHQEENEAKSDISDASFDSSKLSLSQDTKDDEEFTATANRGFGGGLSEAGTNAGTGTGSSRGEGSSDGARSTKGGGRAANKMKKPWRHAGWQPGNQAELDELMLMSPEEIIPEKTDQKGGMKTGKMEEKSGSTKKKERELNNKHNIKDPGFRTDVFTVRQAIRELYRNYTHDDFRKLVNYILRGMKAIKHAKHSHTTYWHVDDPSFRHTTGNSKINRYVKQLLVQMGFACIDNKYWVWPTTHLHQGGSADAITRAMSWGTSSVSKKCAGQNPRRLDDMIKMFEACQRNLSKAEFDGHVKTVQG